MSNNGFPSMTALLGLLAVAGFQNRDKIAEMLGGLGSGASSSPAGHGAAPALPGGLGGLLGGLTGTTSGASAGGLLSGGLGELVDRFTQNGHGATADSWVGNGPNQAIEAPQLQQAIGPDVLATLEKQTGLSRDELLARLSRDLPEAVHRYTPDGRLPGAA